MKLTKLIKKLNDQEKKNLRSVLKLAKSSNFESRHTKHVTKLGLKIFDDLKELHKFDHNEKFLLLCASILHDIGVHTEGPKSHHKTAMKILLNTPILEVDEVTRVLIGLTARYHKGSLPSTDNKYYKSLKQTDQNLINVLAGILRVSDGLDYSHKNKIKDVKTSFTEKKIIFDCLAKKTLSKKEISSASKKGDLLMQHFKRSLEFKVSTTEEFTGWS